MNTPTFPFCFNINNEIWDQDIHNVYKMNWIHDVLSDRTSQVFPYPSQNFKNIALNTKNLLEINKDNDLRWSLDTPLTHDCSNDISIKNDIDSPHKESNKLLYREYHKTEINCNVYPNMDKHMFNNTTKEMFNTHDTRTSNMNMIKK
jgi:hypothetical protein